ncbi:MAG: tRNA (adenosine(37)-N6)-threonylcarbamoyltransferase complex dimerization subunit type 1 TsaB [Proteobacteria bacterium]|nr:tRNA (adenosine(37)-N6)-threonylcarbamoyltransferase complex dimerization subunit type 1 TsaB [Pseudomonadota bacterium]
MSLLLGIDTTFLNKTSVALYSLVEKRIEYHVDTLEFNSSEGLLPIIDESLRLINKTISDINTLVINNGPGSFTGIRTSITAALGICFAKNIPIYTTEDFKHFANFLVQDEEKVYILYCQANVKENYIISYKIDSKNLVNLDVLSIIDADAVNTYIEKLQLDFNNSRNDIEVINIGETGLCSSKLLCECYVKSPESFKVLIDSDLNTVNKINPHYIKGVNALTLKERGL